MVNGFLFDCTNQSQAISTINRSTDRVSPANHDYESRIAKTKRKKRKICEKSYKNNSDQRNNKNKAHTYTHHKMVFNQFELR